MAFAPPSHASPIQTTVLFALEMVCAATTAACAILAFEVDIVKEQRNLMENQQSILKSILSYFLTACDASPLARCRPEPVSRSWGDSSCWQVLQCPYPGNTFSSYTFTQRAQEANLWKFTKCVLFLHKISRTTCPNSCKTRSIRRSSRACSWISAARSSGNNRVISTSLL